MRDFHEFVAWLVEQRIGFWTALDRAGFAAVGAFAHQVTGQIKKGSVNGIVIFSLGTITLATFSAAIQPVIRMAHDRVAS